MAILEKIRFFFKKPQREAFSLIFEDYLKIRAELKVSDIKTDERGINFKVNYRGSTVPFWLTGESGITVEKAKIKIQEILPVIGLGLGLDLNLVEISQLLKKSENLL